jgi:ATP-binding cassette, subfamily F, member 3
LAPAKEEKTTAKKQAAPVREKNVRPEPLISIDEVEKELEELEEKIGIIEEKLLTLTDLDVLQELYREKETLEQERDKKYERLEECL